ncbi:MAG TPA: polyprenyl synthetase family protein, partial [Lysobacter sp.]|nr:polyprenyl synthetase family protein [Lysobacter sp.]
MCGGQALDLAATGHAGTLTIAELERLHALKTGALIRAAVRMGALCGGAGSNDLARLDRYADALGLAFQVRDDILDVEGDSDTLGKTAGKDAAQDKATFPALLGIDASRRRLAELVDAMDDALAPFGSRAAALAALGRHAVDRQH